ncbi:MAG: heme o synthase [Pseudonocardiaceae bacterium]|nr:heme o synthase [Pseudonocardiaceae bacterium]
MSAALGATAAPRRTRGDVVRAVLRSYVALTKPRIIELLLVTTVPAMMLAERGIPSPWLVFATLFGGTMAAGSANALNCVADADIDAVMKRTSARPLPRHQVPTRNALVFGVVLGVLSFAWLWPATNLLAASMAVGAILFYVLVYTMVLKRRTAQNIVWGGAAGCMPVVIGWSAVTGDIGWPALVMFGVIFFWTPPHFWALAMRFRDDYARAGVPMLPVVTTAERVAKQIVTYSWVMVGWTFLLVPATGWVYTGFAAPNMTSLEWKIELIPVPVTDVDRAKEFYAEKLGFAVDVDHSAGDTFRLVQLTPRGSGCSIAIGVGVSEMKPGELKGVQLVVDDIQRAREELVGRGVDASPVFHFADGEQVDGPGDDWNSFVTFSDPDGNGWVVQERPAQG